MKKLIRRVLAVPIGSADVERAFSILSHIRDQRRSKLIPYHLEGLMRIRLNGPKPELFAPLKYAKTWTGILTDDPVNQKKKKTTQSEPKPQENEPSIENEKNEQERLEDEIEPVWDNKPTAEDDDESEIPSSSKDSIEPVPSEFKYMNELPLF